MTSGSGVDFIRDLPEGYGDVSQIATCFLQKCNDIKEYIAF
jgi:hypothetical protein